MGTIKDLVDLVTQLSNSVTDRKFAGELREIQSMIGGILSEHADIHEKDIKLMTENAELKQENANSRQEIVALQQEIQALQNAPKQVAERLPEEAEKILLFITSHPDFQADVIASGTIIDQQRTMYWLGVLCKMKLILNSYSLINPTTYSVHHEGREYLMKNGLI